MIRHRPGFALELLAWGLRGHADEYSDARTESVELNERLPAEYAADSVISVRGKDGHKRFVIVEVQRRFDERKLWSWAAYVGGLMGRYKRAVMLVVFCPTRETADKYRQPISPPESCLLLCPVVVGPDELPVLREPEDVLASLEIATLSAIAHPTDTETLVSVAKTLATSGDERGLIYYDYLRGQLPIVVRMQLEELMRTQVDRLPDAFTRPIEIKAEERGEVRKAVDILLLVLDQRQIRIPSDVRTIVESCTDQVLLDCWLRRALTATNADEVFQDPA
ncbi:hypothetical protein [Nonomuraea rhizosphaerae]|uniref:hypothetical protein n=1 Tax=Nonomuraea rhizosphaerae TaxID=2665663 RepID=UPI001C5E0DA2|nr:hypothetical protein [Nonomuraea rhizosphaerae]